MLIKMGCKKWSAGTQTGLRIYHPSIIRLKTILDIPSLNMRWNSLNHFLNSSRDAPYSRNVLIVNSEGQGQIQATITIARHGESSTQGYITARQDTWFHDFVESNLGINFNFNYITTPTHDLLVVPFPTIISEEKDEIKIKRAINTFLRPRRYSPPPNAQEIGLYFEIQEVQYLLNQSLNPMHRYPLLTTKVPDLISRNVSCDIDVLDNRHRFKKFVEVKSVSGRPGTAFNLTKNEYESRERCHAEGWPYEIVVYYNIGSKVIERRTITVDDDLQFEPSGYWCYP